MVNDGLITERRNDGLEIDRKGEYVISLEDVRDFDGISFLFRVFVTLTCFRKRSDDFRYEDI